MGKKGLDRNIKKSDKLKKRSGAREPLKNSKVSKFLDTTRQNRSSALKLFGRRKIQKKLKKAFTPTNRSEKDG